jgi:hypothetical protein
MTDRMVRLKPADLKLKVATKDLIREVGGQEEAAQFVRRVKRQQSYSDYAKANVDHFIPIDAVAELEEVTFGAPGWPHVTRALCARHGGAFVRPPDAPPHSDDWLSRLAELAADHGAVASDLMKALAKDGLTTKSVREANLVAEADRLFAITAEVAVMLRRIDEGQER